MNRMGFPSKPWRRNKQNVSITLTKLSISLSYFVNLLKSDCDQVRNPSARSLFWREFNHKMEQIAHCTLLYSPTFSFCSSRIDLGCSEVWNQSRWLMNFKQDTHNLPTFTFLLFFFGVPDSRPAGASVNILSISSSLSESKNWKSYPPLASARQPWCFRLLRTDCTFSNGRHFVLRSPMSKYYKRVWRIITKY